MKRYIRSEYNPREEVEEQFQPDVFNKGTVDDILNKLFYEMKNKFGKRYPRAEYRFENIHFDDFYLSAQVKILNNGKALIDKKFEFQPYSDYWDKTDYDQHIATTIQKFISQV